MTKLIEKGFHVKLDGIELSEEALTRIELGIQEVILREVATRQPISEKGSGDGFAFVLPKEWLGFILRRLSPADTETMNKEGSNFGPSSRAH